MTDFIVLLCHCMSHIFSLSLCSLLPWENRHNQKRIFKSCHHCICKPSIYAYLSFIIYYGYIVCPSLSQLQCLISFIPKLLEKEFYYRKTPCLYSLFLVCSVFFLNQFQSDIHFHWSCFFFFKVSWRQWIHFTWSISSISYSCWLFSIKTLTLFGS